MKIASMKVGFIGLGVMGAPMATYLALVAIDSFDEQDDGTAAGVPLRNYVPAGQGGNFAGGLGSQPTMVEYMVDRLGPYPFTEYGAVIVTGAVDVARIADIARGCGADLRDVPLTTEAQDALCALVASYLPETP